MKTILRNILAVFAGLVVGSLVNMGLITAGPFVIPPPEGADVSSMESLRDSMGLFRPAHFAFPFLAHALGALTGAFVAAKLAVSHHRKFAIGIGVAFFIGGVMAATTIGGPAWFNVIDLVLAYLPMAILGGWLATAGTQQSAER
jgi:hypothetical protein